MDNERNQHGRVGSSWQRPPVEERADQVRVWNELQVGDLRTPALRALAEAWEQAAAHEGIRPPSRSAFRPTDVIEALGHVTVLERAESPGGTPTWRYRLMGTEIVSIVQADVTGETIERYHAPLADMLRTQFDRAASAAQPVAFVVRTVVDHRPYAYEKIVLPVCSSPDAGADQVVVASFPTDGR